jgi:CubicO group peptidase (beta-lactamase class C family)
MVVAAELAEHRVYRVPHTQEEGMSTREQLPSDAPTMDRRTWLAGAGSLFLLACAGRQGPGANDTRRPSAPDELADVPRMMRIASVPGVSIGMTNGGSVTTRAFGVTRAQDGEAVTGDTVFEAASLSKPVFAYLVHRLVAEGKLDLDRPLGGYLPLPNPADAAARTITGRHVLSHTSGWRNWRFNRGQQLTADFTPGTSWSYSGEGYYFLQRVVEHVTGQGILRLTQERIFDPLGMRRSSYMWRPDLDANRASPHSNRGVPRDSSAIQLARDLRSAPSSVNGPLSTWRQEEFERAAATIRKEVAPVPVSLVPNVAGSLLTTANDYGTFVRHLWDDPILTRMMAVQVQLEEVLAWGLGVGLETPGASGQTSFWHWGDNPGFKHFVVGDPATKRAVVVFTNGDNGRAIYERVVRRIRGDEPAFLAL